VITQLLGDWVERRRRIREELGFHRDRLEQDFISFGYSAGAARKLATRRLGSVGKHRRQAREQLKARACDLLPAFLALRPDNPWILPSIIGVASLTGDFLLPRNVGMAVPLAIWLSVLLWILPLEVSLALQSRSHWRYYFYSIVSLLSASLATSAAWACMLLIWRIPRWPSQGWSVSVFVVELIAYLLVCWFGLRFWSRNCACRCRSCARTLRLPEEQGGFGRLLVDTATQSSVCIHGHGALTVSYWQRSWHGNGSFWDEMFRPSHS